MSTSSGVLAPTTTVDSTIQVTPTTAGPATTLATTATTVAVTAISSPPNPRQPAPIRAPVTSTPADPFDGMSPAAVDFLTAGELGFSPTTVHDLNRQYTGGVFSTEGMYK